MKKGFTLIELLAVIVILAIIALIATPIVLSIIEDTKESAILRSAEYYLTAVEHSIMKKNMNAGGNFSPNICVVQSNGNLLCDGTDTLEVEVNGDIPTVGTITFDKGKITDVELTLGNKNIVKNEKGELVFGEVSIPEPKSFREDSWETIVANVRAGNLSKYKVGDTKEIALTGFTNTEENSNGLYTIRIANTSTPSECSTSGFSQTACGFVIEFEDIITTHNMNPSGEYKGVQYDYGWNVDGYTASSMYTYIQNDIYNALPKELKAVIIPTYVVSGHGSTSGEKNFTSTDKLYLLTTKEVWGKEGTSNQISLDTAEAETRQLDYYKSVGVTTSSYSGAIKKYNGTANYWWLRSANSYYADYFYGVDNGGDWDDNYATDTSGVAVAFRIG